MDSDFLPRVGAGCLVMLGLFMLISGGIIAFGGESTGTFGLPVMISAGIGFAAAGVFWWRFVRRSEEERRAGYGEREVLLVAARHHGTATLAQVALESNLSAAQAEPVLAGLCRRGLAHPELLDDGTVEYRFGGLEPPGSERRKPLIP